MHGSHSSFAAFSVATLALVVSPAVASAAPHLRKAPRTARVVKSHECTKAPVEVVAGAESATFPLTKCDGAAVPSGVDELSILARPAGAPKPKEPTSSGRSHGAEVTPGIRRIDPQLVERLETVVDHFRKGGKMARVLLVSGYRPRSTGSFHATGRALDFRIEGVENEAVVAFCKTVPDTGCGYYPNSGFVHIDARDHGAGHVAWIDASRPGEAPRYVPAWPAPSSAGDPGEGAEPASVSKLPTLPADGHPDVEPEPAAPKPSSIAPRSL